MGFTRERQYTPATPLLLTCRSPFFQRCSQYVISPQSMNDNDFHVFDDDKGLFHLSACGNRVWRSGQLRMRFVTSRTPVSRLEGEGSEALYRWLLTRSPTRELQRCGLGSGLCWKGRGASRSCWFDDDVRDLTLGLTRRAPCFLLCSASFLQVAKPTLERDLYHVCKAEFRIW